MTSITKRRQEQWTAVLSSKREQILAIAIVKRQEVATSYLAAVAPEPAAAPEVVELEAVRPAEVEEGVLEAAEGVRCEHF